MSEKLEIFDLEESPLGIMERNKYYSEIKKEFAKTGKITRQIKTIRLLLLNSEGRIYLQKRSKLKNQNPGLYDKTVGGHVMAGNTFNIAAIRECAEELGFPAAIVSEKEFDRAIKSDLDIVGIFKKIDYINNFVSVRVDKQGKKLYQPQMAQMYFGYYNGAIKFKDGESSGIEVYSPEDLKDETKKSPDRFTEDIKFMIKKYYKILKPVKT